MPPRQDQHAGHLSPSIRPAITISPSTSSLQGLMGHTTPHTPRSTNSVDERSKFSDDASAQHHYGTVDGSSNSTGKSYSVVVSAGLAG